MYDLFRSVLNCTKTYDSYIFQNKIKYVFVLSAVRIARFHMCSLIHGSCVLARTVFLSIRNGKTRIIH